ncbi:MAG: glycosyltransferase [Candidatus Omnitrophica bacterium]|nr:glycosyltransferase [Candidatus Omnitrophota bacterium]
MRGGEKCLEAAAELFPEAPIYTLFCQKDKISEALRKHPVRPSFVQRFPGILRHYRYFLPLFPLAAETWDLGDYGLVLSMSHCAAKGARKKAGAFHICYCFTPMRYAWGFFEDYFGAYPPPVKALMKPWIRWLRRWDKDSSGRVDCFVAISEHVKKRIRDFYGRDAEVIYPPVDTDFYTPDPDIQREAFYLAVSALVPYKRIDAAVRVFSRSGKELVVIGDGPEREKLEKIAGPSVRFLGWQSQESLRSYYRRARALIFPGEEDFGIVPLEMQACGGFVIAYAEGGALETVLPEETGLFFKSPVEIGLIEAVDRFERFTFCSDNARKNAIRFSRGRFQENMKDLIARKTGGIR